MTLPVFDQTAIEKAVTKRLVLDTVRDALIAHAEGRTSVPPPLHMAFPRSRRRLPCEGRLDHRRRRLHRQDRDGLLRQPRPRPPSNHGLVCVVSARTGQMRALLDDGGLLTAWRTAAAGALITHAMARPDATTLAVFGTGEQARLQATWLAELRTIGTVLVHGRSPHKTNALCEQLHARGLDARPAGPQEAAAADVVITTTPATSPVLNAAHVREGAHVTGIGTDMPHKNELPPALFHRARLIATDDHTQCLDHGDFGHAVRAGATGQHSDTAAGELLKGPVDRPEAAITLADLTGVGALDAALASAVLDQLLR
ncbi:ornithine cyclodeaminase [Streptomyces goshikiensis]